ncbi:MAG TPA: hypothetical protein VGQ83_34810 [Polyangia bacterium]|jgi:hypothetical protein
MSKLRAAAVVVLFAAVPCLSACSAKTDLENICNAEARSGAQGDPATKATRMAAWMEAHVRTKEGRNVLHGLGAVDPARRGELLKQAAREVGYTGPCPMADYKPAAP